MQTENPVNICAKAYLPRIQQQIIDVRMKGIASRILQHMDRIRNVSDLSQAKRWPMELLQNAQDVARPGQPVRVRITLEDNTLTFSHNGRPFRVKDILSIINQVSSKDPDGESVGKFGTGFVTTFQLSETVELASFLQEDALPCKPFRVTLDRSGRDDGEILAAMERSMAQLAQVDGQPEGPAPDPDSFNTSFVYHLTREESRQAALTGVEDLRRNLPYILLFSGKIQEITLCSQTSSLHGTLRCRRQGDGPWQTRAGQSPSLRRMEFAAACTGSEGSPREEHFSLVYLRRDGMTLAAGWTEEAGFTPLREDTPRLFVCFPLIGSEQFPFPLVLDCPGFRVNEPRSGITLVDNPMSRDALVNKEKLRQAVTLYGEFLSQAVALDRRGLGSLLRIPAWREDRELSQPWVREHIYVRLFQTLASEPILRSGEGFRRLDQPGSCLIREADPALRRRLRALLRPLPETCVPEDEEDWASILENYPLDEERIWTLDRLLDRAEGLLPRLQRGEGGEAAALEWLLEVCRLSLEKPETALRVRTGQVRLLPNQADWRDGRLHCVNELKRDPEIPEVLKDVSEQLDRLRSSAGEAPLQLRSLLLHPAFHALPIPELGLFEAARLESYLIRRSSHEYRVADYNRYCNEYHDAWRRAWMLLLSCGPDGELHALCRPFYGEDLPAYEPCAWAGRESVWRPCAVSVLDQVAGRAADCKTLEQLTRDYFEREEDAIRWLNRLIPYGQRFLPREFGYKSVFPNQEGRLKPFQFMKADRTPDDALKEIAYVFREKCPECNFYDGVLDRRLKADLLSASGLREEDVAMVLNRTIQQLLTENSLANAPMEYQVACSRLLSWLQEHGDKAAAFFPAFSSDLDKARLMTPAAVVELQKQSSAVEKLLAETGLESVAALRDRLDSLEKELLERGEAGAGGGAGGWQLSEDLDVLCGAEYLDLEEGARKEFLREIGRGGERYACARIKDYFLREGYAVEWEDDRVCRLAIPADGSDCRTSVVIETGDTGGRYQPGWDFKIVRRIQKPAPDGAGTDDEVFYIEVKTHTASSRDLGLLPLSMEQMKLAARERERYAVLHVTYDPRARCGIGCAAYVDPLARFADGKLLYTGDRFVFRTA